MRREYFKQEEFDKVLEGWEPVYVSMSEEDANTLIVEMLCHFRMGDGKFFEAVIALKGTPEENKQYVQKVINIGKERWSSIFDKYNKSMFG